MEDDWEILALEKIAEIDKRLEALVLERSRMSWEDLVRERQRLLSDMEFLLPLMNLMLELKQKRMQLALDRFKEEVSPPP